MHDWGDISRKNTWYAVSSTTFYMFCVSAESVPTTIMKYKILSKPCGTRLHSFEHKNQ